MNDLPTPTDARTPACHEAPTQVAKPRLWSLEPAAQPDQYLLSLRLQDGQHIVVQFSSLQLLGMAEAVLDDQRRAGSAQSAWRQ